MAGRSDEGRALPVLLVARLLADQHHAGVGRTGGEDRLGGRFPELAAPAVPGGRAQPVEVGVGRDEVGRSHGSTLTAANTPQPWLLSRGSGQMITEP